MAGKYGSNSAAIFLMDGYNMLASKIQDFRFKIEALRKPTHGCGDGFADVTPVGVSKAEVSQGGGFWDTIAGRMHAMLASQSLTPQSAARVTCLGFAGNVIGMPFIGFQGAHVGSYEVLAQNEDLHHANAEHAVTGVAEQGVILHAHTAETADANTEATSSDHTTEAGVRVYPITSNTQANPTVITTPIAHNLTTGDTVLIAGVTGSSPTINGIQTVTVISATTFSVPVNTSAGTGGTGGTFTVAKTNAGGAGYVELTDLTLGGYTSVTITFRHSVDNATFADLLVMTTRVAIGAERKTVAGAVNRYLAQNIDFVGAGSGATATYLAGFART